MRQFRDRTEAGQDLAGRLDQYANRDDVLVLGLPRGGVPVACEVATALDAPLDVFVVRKLGVPGHEELAMGAIASGGIRVLNEDVVRTLDISDQAIDAVAAEEQEEVERRERRYRGERSQPELRDKIVILVDDGIATGATMRAAIAAVQEHDPSRIVVAVPVAPVETFEALESDSRVAEVVCLRIPEPFVAIGTWYEDFSQTTDQDVRKLLSQSPASARST